MSNELTKKEIYERMIEWRNLKKLHQAARDRVVALEKENEHLKEQVKEQQEVITHLTAMVTKQSLHLEELRAKVFGKKKLAKKPKPRTAHAPREKDSYHRPAPEKVTSTQHHTLATCTCSDCGGALEARPARTYYEEDIVLPGMDDLLRTTAVIHVVECAYCPQCKKLITAVPVPNARVVLQRCASSSVPVQYVCTRVTKTCVPFCARCSVSPCQWVK